MAKTAIGLRIIYKPTACNSSSKNNIENCFFLPFKEIINEHKVLASFPEKDYHISFSSFSRRRSKASDDTFKDYDI